MIKCFTHEIDHSSKFNCQDSKSKSWICCDLKCAQKEVNYHLYMLHILILFSKEKGLLITITVDYFLKKRGFCLGLKNIYTIIVKAHQKRRKSICQIILNTGFKS